MQRSAAGFTLLELLVVLLLLSIAAGLAVISVDIGGASRSVEEEMRRLALVLEETCETAILDTRELGIRFTPDGYRFSQWTGQLWEELYEPPLHAPQRLQPGFYWRLELEGLPVILDDDAANFEPHVVCWSSSEMTPFELALMAPQGDVGRRLVGRLDGHLEAPAWVDDGS